MRLDQVAALCDIFGGLHFVPSQHPYLDVSPQHVSDGLWHVVLKPVKHGCCSDQIQLSLKLGLQLLDGFLPVLIRQVLLCFDVILPFTFGNDSHSHKQGSETDGRELIQLIVQN